MMDAIFVGIDVSKDQLDVHILPGNARFFMARTAAGIEALAARLTLAGPVRAIAMEATGGLEKIAAAALAKAGLPVAVVNPSRICAFARALGKRAKTDPIDAGVIARFAAVMKPEIRALPSEDAQALAELVARRRQLVDMIVAEGQREKRAANKRLAQSIANVKTALEKELADIDAQIDDAARKQPEWKQKDDLLRSVPGVGRVIARVLIADLPELGSLGRRQIAALAGLCPWTRQSGKWKGKSCIGGGRSNVRAALFMAAMVAKKHNPTLKTFYEKLLQAGKPKLVALIAVARKILTILNAILRESTPWQPKSA